MTAQEINQHLTQLLIRLEGCRKLEHGDLVPDEEIQALSETVNPIESPYSKFIEGLAKVKDKDTQQRIVSVVKDSFVPFDLEALS